MKYVIDFPEGKLNGRISLPFSKSISNRLLIIRALSNSDFHIEGLSESDDTQVLLKGLQTSSDVIDIDHAGTAMRFLTAYFAATAQAKTVTGSERMKNRPVGVLVDALNHLKADIKYLEKSGFPPIRTSGKPLLGNTINIKGNISSQFISALLMIAPVLPNGLTIAVTGELVSVPYIKMTIELMRQANVSAKFEKNIISVSPQNYSSTGMSVERDYSAASYWYLIAALANNSELLLEGLSEKSLQGDAIISQIASLFGVKTENAPEGAIIRKDGNSCRKFLHDFTDSPDLIQTMAVMCCLTNTKFRFCGAQTLRIKETDRIAALQNELLKLGYCIKATNSGALEWNGERITPQQNISISTYNDHRMAMAFAPAAIHFPGLQIEEPKVVSKSYPNFWEDLKMVGARIEVKDNYS